MNKLSARYRLTKKSFCLDVELALPESGVTALFGRSGSGKTTLLRCLAGLENPAEKFCRFGEVLWDDTNFSLPPHQRAIGFVFQQQHLFPHLSIRENLDYGFKRTRSRPGLLSPDDAIDFFDLADWLPRYPHQLSVGQQQRVALARALLAAPQLLLMDEPLASLDITSKQEILPFIEQLPKAFSLPIVYVTHSPDELLRISERMILMENGRVMAEGPVNQVLTDPSLPLIHQEDACAIFEGTVIAHDRAYHISEIQVGNQRLLVSELSIPPGQPARIRVRAKDVSLALSPHRDTSINNILPVKVREVVEATDPAKVMVQLAMDNTILLAEITRRSADLLHIAPGLSLFAQIKSVALLK